MQIFTNFNIVVKYPTFCRIWLNDLAYFTPNFLKKYLPYWFSTLLDRQKANIEACQHFREFLDKKLHSLEEMQKPIPKKEYKEELYHLFKLKE